MMFYLCLTKKILINGLVITRIRGCYSNKRFELSPAALAASGNLKTSAVSAERPLQASEGNSGLRATATFSTSRRFIFTHFIMKQGAPLYYEGKNWNSRFNSVS
jgi:hypothetical protein